LLILSNDGFRKITTGKKKLLINKLDIEVDKEISSKLIIEILATTDSTINMYLMAFKISDNQKKGYSFSEEMVLLRIGKIIEIVNILAEKENARKIMFKLSNEQVNKYVFEEIKKEKLVYNIEGFV